MIWPSTWPFSPDALLERIRRAPRLGAEQVKVLGVDDWDIKKGHSYGTILVDLERRRVVDLLPERTAEALAESLKVHLNIEMVSRDRYQPYIDGIRAGAPKALQVADRWHLLKNLTDAVERLLERERISLSEALKLMLPELPYVPQIMAAYLRFWWKYERSEPEEMWEMIPESASTTGTAKPSTTSWGACEGAYRRDAPGKRPSRPKPKPEDECPGLLAGSS